MSGRLAVCIARLIVLRATISSADRFKQPQAREKSCARREAGASREDLSRMLQPWSRARAKTEQLNENRLTIDTHAIVPSHDDGRAPNPDDCDTTSARRAIRGARPTLRNGPHEPPPA